MPKLGTLFPELRKEMKAKDIDNAYLAQELGLSLRSIYGRFSNKKTGEWKLNEIYRVCDILGQPYSAIPRLFPYYPTRDSKYARHKRR